jgi:hypothetical protein
MKNSLIFISVIGLLLAATLYWEKEGNPETCRAYCMSNEVCMQALQDGDIAPYGSTRNNEGMCNGICSTLRKQTRQAQKNITELGMEDENLDLAHPCLPEDKSKSAAP